MPKSTEALSPQEVAKRASALAEQMERLQEQSSQIEIEPASTPPSEKSVSTSKTIINASYIVFGLVGVVGSFWDAFDMVKFVQFIEAFAYIWVPLVITVGAGRGFKNFVTKKYGEHK